MKNCLRSTTAIAFFLFATTPLLAQAQETDESVTNEDEANQIVVTGTPVGDSIDAALRTKRAAVNVVDVISSDTIGRFPDQNLADSLNRLPGVAVERDQGQARFVNFRGAPFRFTAIAFDGIDIPGASNGRIPRFDSFPATIVSGVEANKAITPDMPGEAVSGFINLKTFDPFRRDGFHFSVEGGLGVQELGNGNIDRYNGRLSYSNDTIGIVVFGSHNSRDQTTDNREFDVTQDGLFSEVQFRNYLVQREDNSYGGRLEYRGEGALSRLFVSSIYSEFEDNELRNQYNFDLSAPIASGEIGTDDDIGVTRLLQDGRYLTSTFTNTLGADFEFDDWLLEVRGNYTETRDQINLVIPFSTAGSAAGAFDLTNVEDPILNLSDPATGNAITVPDIAYPANFLLPVVNELDINAYQVKADLTGDIDLFGNMSTLKIGAKYDSREASGFDTVVAFNPAPAGFDFDRFDTGELWPTDFNNTVGGTLFDNEGVIAAIADTGADLVPDVPEDLRIAIEEDIYSAYAMLTSEFDWGSLVFGGRVEVTDFVSTGNGSSELPDGSVVVSPVVAENDYVHFLPSIHANFDLSDDAILRASISTGVNRPTYIESRASIAVDATDLASGGLVTVGGGNPALDAETAWGGDLSFEYYFDEGSLFAIAGFARFIDNVIYAESIFFDDISGFDANIPAGSPGFFSSFQNGEDGELFGVEVTFTGRASSFTDGFLGGFGIETSATFLDSSFTIPAVIDPINGDRAARDLRLPGTSDFIFNGSIFWENYGFSLRANYTYRDDWLDETESEGNDQFWAAQERVDVSARYTFENLFEGVAVTLFADANNLTNAVDVRYTNTAATPNQVEGYGARYLFGFRIDY